MKVQDERMTVQKGSTYNEMGLEESQKLDHVTQASETMVRFIFVLEANRS